MTRQHIRIPLILLIGLLPVAALAQPIITIAPQAVGGISCRTSNAPLFGTPFFSGIAGIDGSLWGITGDSNLAFTLGIDYDSRGWSTVGDASQPVPGVEEGWGFYSKYDFQMNSIGIDLSIRSQWFQAGSEVDIPIYGHLEINSSNSSYSGAENIPKADLNTTIGIFCRCKFPGRGMVNGQAEPDNASRLRAAQSYFGRELSQYTCVPIFSISGYIWHREYGTNFPCASWIEL